MIPWFQRHQKKIFRMLFPVLLIGYSGILFLSFAKIPIHADFASLVLEAQDMLHGNFFLSGWNLTGATFTFSELLFYAIGTAVFGVQIKAYIFATTLMFLLMILLGFLLTRTEQEDHPWQRLLIFFAIAGFPGIYWSENLRAHTGIFVYAFATVLCLRQLSRARSRWLAAGYVLLIALGTMSDAFILPAICLPVLLFGLFHLVSNRPDERLFNRRIFILTILGIVAGVLLLKAYLAIGGANENSLSGMASFSEVEDIPVRIGVYISILLKMFGCDFSGVRIFSLDTIWIFLRGWILLFGFHIIYRTLKDFISGKNTDTINTILCLGILTQSVFLILTPFMSKLHSGRYISWFPIAFAVIILREMQHKKTFALKIAGGRLPLRFITALLSLLLIVSATLNNGPISVSRTATEQDRLATFLREQGLVSGYADFLTANAVTVAAENRVRLRALSFEPLDGRQQPYAYLWFSKTEWYSEAANFVVISEAGFRQVNETTVTALIGEPAQILRFENYAIYIYDQDISAKIVL